MAISVTSDHLTGAFREIIQDHDEAIQLCDRLASAALPEERSRLLASLPENIRALIHAEDITVFQEPNYRDNNFPDVKILQNEHEEIDSLLSQLTTTDVESKDWRNKVQALTELVEMHAVGTQDFLSSIYLKLSASRAASGFEFSSNHHPSKQASSDKNEVATV